MEAILSEKKSYTLEEQLIGIKHVAEILSWTEDQKIDAINNLYTQNNIPNPFDFLNNTHSEKLSQPATAFNDQLDHKEKIAEEIKSLFPENGKVSFHMQSLLNQRIAENIVNGKKPHGNLTKLLRLYGSSHSAVAFNKKLIALELLELKIFAKCGSAKVYKAFTEKGSRFGVSTPHSLAFYYETFKELLNIVEGKI